VEPLRHAGDRNGPTCDILIRSYWRDFGWLAYCLASIEKHCHGFRSTIVVVPSSSSARLRRLGDSLSRVRIELCDEYRDDYLGQQVTKLNADALTDADLVCHVDSDCVFVRDVSPLDLLRGGKVRVLMRPTALLGRHRPWHRSTEEFLGWSVAYDFMQHPPFTYPRWLYAHVRRHCVAVHGVALADYVASRPPRGFSEFNVLGAFAYERERDRFSWVDTSREDAGEPSCRWYWSWGGIEPSIRSELDALL
jgi:hypothetical protein